MKEKYKRKSSTPCSRKSKQKPWQGSHCPVRRYIVHSSREGICNVGNSQQANGTQEYRPYGQASNVSLKAPLQINKRFNHHNLFSLSPIWAFVHKLKNHLQLSRWSRCWVEKSIILIIFVVLYTNTSRVMSHQYYSLLKQVTTIIMDSITDQYRSFTSTIRIVLIF